MTRYDPQKHHRRSIRLKGYDYSQPGAYFFTLVAEGRQPVFSQVQDGIAVLTEIGRIVQRAWFRLPAFFPVILDEHILMPDHFHGILFIQQTDDGRCKGEASDKPISLHNDIPGPMFCPNENGTQPGSLNAIIQNFKSTSTRKINQYRGTPGLDVWQRNYYERIIRDEEELNRARVYIRCNPFRWDDKE